MTLGAAASLFAGGKSCYDDTQSPEYDRAKKIDKEAALILPSPQEIRTFTFDDGKTVSVSIRESDSLTYLESWEDDEGMLCFEFSNLMFLSESFFLPYTSDGNARNLDELVYKRRSLTRNKIPDYKEWQRVYEDLIDQVAQKSNSS